MPEATIAKVDRMTKAEDRLNDLENRIQLLEIIAKKVTSETLPEPQQEEMKKVIQINANGKTYFCETSQEQHVFSENNPDVKTETFHIELEDSTARRYLNDPENKKQFTKREKVKQGV